MANLSDTEQKILKAIVAVTRVGVHTEVSDLSGLSNGFNPSKHVARLVRLGLVARTPRRRGYCYATAEGLGHKTEAA